MEPLLEPLPFTVVSATLFVATLLLASLRPALMVDHPWTVLAVLAAATLGALSTLVSVSPVRFTLGLDASTEPLIPSRTPAFRSTSGRCSTSGPTTST